MSRSRVRTDTRYFSNNGVDWNYVYADKPYEMIDESKVPGGNRVRHFATTSNFTGKYITNGWVMNYFVGRNRFNQILSFIGRPSVRWEDLPTSSKFGIIQFFAELDSTLAMFTYRFWRRLNYGSLTWGVMPFVFEISAILETIRNFQENLESIEYERSRKFNLRRRITDLPFGFDLEVVQRLQGTVFLAGLDEAALWLDRLGFHPDIGTAWDLVPLSFMVDWFFPVGGYLSRLYDRGWVDHVPFQGWVSTKFSGTTTVGTAFQSSYLLDPYGPVKVKGYARDFVKLELPVETRSKDLSLDLPTLSQVFNTFYLLWLGSATKNRYLG